MSESKKDFNSVSSILAEFKAAEKRKNAQKDVDG